MKIIERIFNAETGETVDIERDMTPGEKKEFDVKAAEVANRLKAEKESAEKRGLAISKLAALGLTEDDLKALGL